jgi:hypothetical protein
VETDIGAGSSLWIEPDSSTMKRNQTPMNKIVHYSELDVHKQTIAVAIAPAGTTEVCQYGILGGSLDAVDKLIKKIARGDIELRFVYEGKPGRRSGGFVCLG